MGFMNVRGFAFFDLDSTLISVNSMISFLKYYYMNGSSLPFEDRAHAFEEILKGFNREISLGKDRYHVYREYYRLYEGADVVEIRSLASKWWEDQVKSVDTFIGATLKDRKSVV
jgi:phosphoserine phosphatase